MVLLIYPDQEDCFRQSARLAGVPDMRTVHVSRTLPGPQDVDRFIGELMDALIRPLTAKEQQKSVFGGPEPRILFEGTLEEAEVFYAQTEQIPALENAIYFKYSDGLPVVIPTEERVAAMLKGTSHKPDEVLTFHADHTLDPRQLQMGRSGKKGDQCRFVPMKRRATVEKIATIGVMAGCKPEHMPILLAMAEAGGGSGDGRAGDVFILSGPIGRQIGMNFNVNVMGPGSPNRVLGRAADLMFRNLGGNIPAVTNCGVWGHPVYNVVPENTEALPPGWKGVNEEYDFKKNESCLVVYRIGKGFSPEISQTMFSPGGYRAFQKSGHGGIARRLGVKGVPGPKNWVEYQLSSFWAGNETGYIFYMLPEMARHLWEAGFKTKDSFYEWMYKKSFMTKAQYYTHSWPDVNTNAWNADRKDFGQALERTARRLHGTGDDRSVCLHGRSYRRRGGSVPVDDGAGRRLRPGLQHRRLALIYDYQYRY